jgi:hypothetical protein
MKPAISVDALTQYQSDVPTPPPFLPGGTPLFLPPKGTIDAFVRLDQRLFDATVGTAKRSNRRGWPKPRRVSAPRCSRCGRK